MLKEVGRQPWRFGNLTFSLLPDYKHNVIGQSAIVYNDVAEVWRGPCQGAPCWGIVPCSRSSIKEVYWKGEEEEGLRKGRALR